MDTSDRSIIFDHRGVCVHCLEFDKYVIKNWHPNTIGKNILEKKIAEIKLKSKHLPYDCIMGVSGGTDSSFMLHLTVSEFGLRPLVFHVDGGWNSNSAVHNIQVLIQKLNIDLYTEVINWEEMKAIQLAYFKSGLSSIDVPQDQVNIAALYKFALKENIKYIFNGGNFSTECVRNPKDWIYYGTDMLQFRDIKSRFCKSDLPSFPISSILFHKFYLRFIKNIQVIKPLNFLPYVKSDAVATLEKIYGWKSFNQKHFESRFTKFYESFWLPTRFGFDVRRVQFSSLILTGQMSRNDAIEELKKSPFDISSIDQDFLYIATKLGISVEELDRYHKMPLKTYKDYRNQAIFFELGAKFLRAFGAEGSIKK